MNDPLQIIARGTIVGDELLRQIREGPRQADNRIHLASVDFSKSIFESPVNFRNVVFEGDADFSEATFNTDVSFKEASFSGDARFDRTAFNATVDWGETKFQSSARFDRAVFRADVRFSEARFGQSLRFDRTVFQSDADFRAANLPEDTTFWDVEFLANVRFDRISFHRSVDINIEHDLECTRTRFMAGGHIYSAGRPSIDFTAAEFPSPFIVSGRQNPYLAVSGTLPRIVSLERANVRGLVLTDVDLEHCRFAGAHGLDGLRINGVDAFARAPGWFGSGGRRVLAEEVMWRIHSAASERWRRKFPHLLESMETALGDEEIHLLRPMEIASIYRGLRKGLEDSKDEPGAADFYYGEMEMRRHDQSRSRAERLIIFLYWLVSGYGLRASRALLSLFVTVCVFGVLLYRWGFPSQSSFLDALTFSAESTTSLFRPPQRELTLAGEWLQIGLRLLGPLFFGLALLSLRGRVKR